jgi:hypothetical protein
MNDYEMMWKELKEYCERAEKELYAISEQYYNDQSEKKRLQGKADGVGMILSNMVRLEYQFNRE